MTPERARAALREGMGYATTPSLLLALLTIVRLVVAAGTNLSPDEAYYWVWSRVLQPGYLDHPPMVALWIRTGTLLAGHTPLGVRLLAPFAAALGSWLLAQAAEDLVPGRRAGLIAATLLNATLLFGVGAVTMTPDTPLLFFWTATLWAMARLIRTGNAVWWLVAGLAAGAALDSKYTAFLLVAGLGLWAVLTPRGRRWLHQAEPWFGGALAVLVFTPVLAWNAGHGWASFLKQGGRSGVWHPADAARFLGELVGGQVGLATPVVFALCVIGAWVVTRRALKGAPEPALLACLILPGAAVFLEHALGDRVQGNWPAILYPAGAIAAAAVPTRWWRAGAAIGFAATALIYVQAVAMPLPLSPHMDPTLARLGGWRRFAGEVERARRAAGAEYVVADNYGVAAILAWQLPESVPVVGIDPHWRYLRLIHGMPVARDHVGLLVRSERRGDEPDAAPWTALAPAGNAARARRGVVAERYLFYRVTGGQGLGESRLLPHP
jgi:4-amino-4-deoxy-L-arabinose transferase-like glycosyltransferase